MHFCIFKSKSGPSGMSLSQWARQGALQPACGKNACADSETTEATNIIHTAKRDFSIISSWRRLQQSLLADQLTRVNPEKDRRMHIVLCEQAVSLFLVARPANDPEIVVSRAQTTRLTHFGHLSRPHLKRDLFHSHSRPGPGLTL